MLLLGPGRTSHSPSIPLEDMTPEQTRNEELKVSKAALNTAVAALKRAGERARREMTACLEDCKVIITKGYPPEMKKHFEQDFNPILDKSVSSLEEWAQHAKMNLDKMTVHTMDEIRGRIETHTKEILDDLTAVEPKKRELKQFVN